MQLAVTVDELCTLCMLEYCVAMQRSNEGGVLYELQCEEEHMYNDAEAVQKLCV